jgi:hypothetical protein
VAETYLRNRGITIELPPSLRYHARMKHTDTGLMLPCMVGAVQGPDRQIIGLHRTYLRADGMGKAGVSNPRKMLGTVRGGAVRLAKPDFEVAIAEGIETALSYMQITGTPTWAALSSSGLMAVEVPDDLMLVTIVVDADPAGEQAAQVAGDRFSQQGLKVQLVRPTRGNDLNDILQEGAP